MAFRLDQPQKWRRLGRFFHVDQLTELMHSHAAVPFAERISGDIYRVYFSSRDRHMRARTYSLVLDINQPDIILEIDVAPFIDLGARGAFDDDGAMISWITPAGPGERLVYYFGWNRGVSVPYRNSIGVIHESAERRTRYPGPTIDRTLTEPHFCSSPAVLNDDGLYRAYYLACVEWVPYGDGVRHRYHLRYAESDDGLYWRRDGTVAIDFKDKSEYAISRPSVLKTAAGYAMWYPVRGDKYRIGYAYSDDGVRWTRRDDLQGLQPAGSGWDGGEVTYPHVIQHEGETYMFYNGEGYGKTGLGLAILNH